jgi:hypothetical protein
MTCADDQNQEGLHHIFAMPNPMLQQPEPESCSDLTQNSILQLAVV